MRLVAVAAAVPGVLSVEVTRLRRLWHEGLEGPKGSDDGTSYETSHGEALEDGILRLGPLEIAQCDNDPDRPENGRLVIELKGAR